MYDRKDSYYRKAKASGLRSRAAFKLEDVAGDLLRPGSRVLDLGSWPGGWLQVASRRVGDRGRVVGTDLRPIEPLGLANLRFIEGDVRDPETLKRILESLDGPADVVLSDMSPGLTGIRDRDEAEAEELARAALSVVGQALRRGGGFVCKVFMNAAYPELLGEFRRRFDKVSATRPRSTRKGSAELYVVARGFRRG